MSPKIVSVFVCSAGVLLLATGAAKIISATGSARALGSLDPIFGIPFRELFLAVGVIEALVGIGCLSGRDLCLHVKLVAILSANFALYRAGVFLLGWHAPCGCLGNLTAALPVSHQAAEAVMKVVLAYLLVGSCAAALLVRSKRDGSCSSPDIAARADRSCPRTASN